MNIKLLEVRKREDILRINYTVIHHGGPKSGFSVVFLAFSVKNICQPEKTTLRNTSEWSRR